MSAFTPRRWRSRKGMLLEGSTDGKYKKATTDWSPASGCGVEITVAARGDMQAQNGLSFVESPRKHAPGQWAS